MRKTFKFMAMGAAMAFAACGKDDDNETGSDTGGGNTGGGTGTETAEWVDLGLPSGLLWAKCNLGASSPEEYGDYYAWGETTANEVYDWNTYKYSNGHYTRLTKYCHSSDYGYNGFTDNLTTLEAMDDAATQKLGSGARMPTKAEWEELINNTTAEWTTLNGVNGRKLTASNGKSLFLPAAGHRWDGELSSAGSIGCYRSSSLYAGSPHHAWYFYFYLGGIYKNKKDNQSVLIHDRDRGFSVRAVRASQN